MRALPDEVAAIATSIALERDASAVAACERELDRAEILADVLARPRSRRRAHVAHKGLGLVHARLTRHDALAGQQVESVAGRTAATCAASASGIDLDGRLLVRGEDGMLTRVASGEIRAPRGRRELRLERAARPHPGTAPNECAPPHRASRKPFGTTARSMHRERALDQQREARRGDRAFEDRRARRSATAPC